MDNSFADSQTWSEDYNLRLTATQPLADFCNLGTLVWAEKDGK